MFDRLQSEHAGKNLGIRNIGDDVEGCQMKWKHPEGVHEDRMPNLSHIHAERK
jgi:hypothetical protein